MIIGGWAEDSEFLVFHYDCSYTARIKIHEYFISCYSSYIQFVSYNYM